LPAFRRDATLATAMEFLLECIGFPPDFPAEEIVRRVQKDGEPAAWRGEPDRHLRLSLGGGLEVRIDRDHGQRSWNVLPHYRARYRLRVSIDEIRALPDSPFDALLFGWAAPPLVHEREGARRGAYRMCAYITDARRLPPRLSTGHVLALSFACFALDVSFVGPDDQGRHPGALERAEGASIVPLGSPEDPGGCAEVSLRIREILHLENPITGEPVDVIHADAPERPLALFVSQWQLERDGLPRPRAGWRIEGTFLFSGRIAGGLPGPRQKAGGSFG
jgi:hypothetical protein